MKTKRAINISLLLSVAIHAALTALVVFNPQFDPSRVLTKQKPVEVELMSPEELQKALQAQKNLPPQGQIVEQDQQLNDEIDDKAKYLSKHNQKVVRETQAQLHGKFKNTDSSSGEKSVEQKLGKEVKKIGEESDKDVVAEEKTEKKEETPKEFLTSEDGPAVRGKKPTLKDLMPSFKPGPPPIESKDVASGGGEGPSASDDHLKNVATGMQTLLSTREFVYYSYYNRIKDKLRQHWEPKIKEKMERIVRQGRTIASDSNRITRIVIHLDPSGTLVRVQIVGPSGVNDLDDAAVEAFRAAAPFPNPPKGIVDPDGTIKIRWDFILEANNNGLLNAIRFAKSAG